MEALLRQLHPGLGPPLQDILPQACHRRVLLGQRTSLLDEKGKTLRPAACTAPGFCGHKEIYGGSSWGVAYPARRNFCREVNRRSCNTSIRCRSVPTASRLECGVSKSRQLRARQRGQVCTCTCINPFHIVAELEACALCNPSSLPNTPSRRRPSANESPRLATAGLCCEMKRLSSAALHNVVYAMLTIYILKLTLAHEEACRGAMTAIPGEPLLTGSLTLESVPSVLDCDLEDYLIPRILACCRTC